LRGIFVSYRRSDSQGEAGRLFDDLVKHFGEDSVFMDVAAIEAGRDFRKAIEEGVTQCGVLLVMIGLEWLSAKDERGVLRLSDPSDFVRLETASALKRDIPVIPVLVRGAKMPSEEQLPADLKDLAFRNGIELTHARWRSDIQLLVEALRRLLGDTSTAGTSAPRGGPAALAPSGTPQQELKAPLGTESGNYAQVDPESIRRVTRELALRIGPIADIVVKRAASRCSSLEDLYIIAAEEIDSREGRQKFLLGRTASAPAQPHKVSGDAPPAKIAPELAKRASPPRGEEMPSERPPHATAVRTPGGRKQLLIFGGAAVLILAAMGYLLLKPSIRSSPQPSTAPILAPADMRVAKAVPVADSSASPASERPAAVRDSTPSPAAPQASENEHASPVRFRLTEQMYRNLLIMPAVQPQYPPLAKQAHIQGNVVLDANISKDGTIETLRVVSGHPLLIQSALNAVKQWRFRPCTQHGQRVATSTEITVAFTLSNS
jgi:TonB family protein